MGELTTEQFKAAEARGKARLEGPRGRNRIIVKLTTDIELGFAASTVEGLQNATIEDLKAVEVEAFGLGMHFPTIDADLYVPALLEGILGSKRWMAARLATAGGRSRTSAKTAASRENGKLGGRPRKAHVP